MPTEKAIEAARRVLEEWSHDDFTLDEATIKILALPIATALDAFAADAVVPWRAALEALGDDVRYGKCWCAPFKSDGPHDPECLQARKLFEGDTTHTHTQEGET